MSQLRRGYVYLICVISLVIVGIGLANVLEIAALYLWQLVTGDRIFGESPSEIRQRLSLYLALTGVALPILLLHIYLAERWSASPGPESDRTSAIRGFYFALVLAFSLLFAATTLTFVIDSGIARLFGEVIEMTARDTISAIIFLAIAAGIWATHAWMRHRDANLIDLPAQSDWPVRLYIYAALFFSAISLLSAFAWLLATLVGQAFEHGTAFFSSSWDREMITFNAAQIATGGIIWGMHWAYSRRLIRHPGFQGVTERGSILRAIYLALMTLITIAVTLVLISLALGEVLRPFIGPAAAAQEDPLLSRVLQLALAAIPFAVFWWLHRRTFYAESEGVDARVDVRGAKRLHGYMLGFVGFVVGAVGLGYLAGVTLELMFSGVGFDNLLPSWFPERTNLFVAFLLIGTAVWIPQWIAQQRTAVMEPLNERGSYSRRAYLYLVLSFSTLALLAALSTLLYQLFQTALGVRTSAGIGGDIAVLLGISLVAGVALGYHLRCLLIDTRYAFAEPYEVPPAPPVSAPSMVRASLSLTAPDEAELRDLVERWRAELPEGVSLVQSGDIQQVPGPGPTQESTMPTQDDIPHQDFPRPGSGQLTPERPA